MLALLASSCGGGGETSEDQGKEGSGESQAIIVTKVFFRDHDSTVGEISGPINITFSGQNSDHVIESVDVTVNWLSDDGHVLGESIIQKTYSYPPIVELPANTVVPAGADSLRLSIGKDDQQLSEHMPITFHDFTGNADISGPGGNELQSWYYGVERPKITAYRTDESGGTCVYDNGLVAVSDMGNTKDVNFEGGVHSPGPNLVDDDVFPPYQFSCTDSLVNEDKDISDEYGIWTYSTLNDAMFYGTVAYDTFLEHLGEPPLKDKVRLRVHYGNLTDLNAFWDGAYANFSDAFLTQYSTASLDVIAHEIAHGVLDRISALTIFPNQLGDDAKTLHEAFGDISGVLVKHAFQPDENLWKHGGESQGSVRQLDTVITEQSAVASYLDYDEAGNNFYLRIGLITYPFYLLANQWGVDDVYQVYLHAAKTCWLPTSTLHDAAGCILVAADEQEQPILDVINAFKAVKIKLFDEGVLSHFRFTANGLNVEFSDNSQSTSTISQWRWEFGDGVVSTDPNPSHVYSAAGDFQVTLSVMDQYGDEDVFLRNISVVEPEI